MYLSDLPKKEREDYSLMRAIHAQLAKNPKEAPFEYEVSNYIAEQTGQPARGIYIPRDVLSRDLNTGTPSAGGDLIETTKPAVTPSLYAQTQVFKLGAAQLNDLIGDIGVPYVSTGLSLTETAESAPATQQDPVFGLVSLTPQQHSVQVDLSRRLVKQSSVSVDQWLSHEISNAVAAKIDELAISEILGNTSVPVVAMGSNGLALTWGKTCELEETVANNNGIINAPGWLTNHLVASKLKQVEKATGSGFIYAGDDSLAVNPIGLSSQVPNDLDKGTSIGVCSAMVFGSWDQLVVAQWNQVDIVVDRYSLGITGGMRVIAWLDADVGLRNPKSFAVIKDILTA